MSLFGHSLAAPYALDALEGAERGRFERHLEGCARCAAEVRALSEDAVRLARSTAAPAPPALRERVLAAVRTTAQEPAPARGPVPRRSVGHVRPRPLLVPFATVTAAAALVVASLFAVRADRTRDELATARDRAREIAHVLAAPDARAARGADARGRGVAVVASASRGRAVVTLSGYGEPPGDRVRQLWVMRPGAEPRSLGLFDGDTPLVAAGLSRSATSLAVTVEPGGGSDLPTTEPVVQLALESVGFGE
ncbi:MULTISPECIES: anti-sigma factor [Streptomyces]|uniref:anti-sigma factor n=1 Tax=Streptomyces TaxID=1883 RepID=UPI0029A58BF1|nr:MULTISPECIES: anti-sigma factor [unclassified Streptomyces]MDX3345325.1 anti-sigma factor [Streptomyces sp. ME02-6979A]MDX3398915.1 anti-sigma factor [Streptomyces sp. ME01-18h]